MFSNLSRIALASTILLSIVSPSSAVIINSTSGTNNISAPSDDPGWNNVLSRGGSTCVYLGNDWVLTAAHVGAGSVTINGVPYAPISGSTTRLTTTYTSDGSTTTTYADLVMFRLNTTDKAAINLPSLNIIDPDETIYTNTLFTAIGNGRNRAANKTYWNSSWGTVSGGAGAAYSGYFWGSGNSKRWGTNTHTDADFVEDDGWGESWMIETTFNSTGDADEMQVAMNDSGGGVFMKADGTWYCSGIILALDEIAAKPSSLRWDSPTPTAVYGDTSYFADLRYYADQIESIRAVPEPASVMLLLTGTAAAWLFLRRRKAPR